MTDDKSTRGSGNRSPGTGSVGANIRRGASDAGAASQRSTSSPSRHSDVSKGPDPSAGAVRVQFDAFELDAANARLLREGKPLAVAPKPFALLCALVSQRGSLITKDALLDAVWGHRYVSESVLKTAVSDLRTALGDDARQPRYIETVSRHGYRFICPTSSARETHPATKFDLMNSPLIGRNEALARLRGAFGLSTAGRRTIVWVAGDPGVGKTTLVDHFIEQLADVSVGRGQCVEQYGHGEPYLPILDALGELCRTDANAADLLRAVAPFWLMQLPWLTAADEREALRRELAGARPDRMLRELGEFLNRYAEHRTLVLVTEDLHWSDQATIQLMDYIARRRGHLRLMWISTFRLADIIAQDHPFKAVRSEFRLHGLCDEIVLDPFSEQDVAAYIAQRAPSLAITESDVRALHERTDGLPLLIAQLVDDLAARKSRESDASAATLLEQMAIPENLAAIIDHYIARLTIEQRAVLDAAAVCGVEFRVDIVATALEQDAANVSAVCDALVRGHMWLVPSDDQRDAEHSKFRFRHALFRQGLYERMAPRVRTQLHRKIGTALERDRERGSAVAPTELVMHFERGAEPMAALRHCVHAAETLLHLSPGEVMRLTERGLALVDRLEKDAERDALELSLWTLRGVSEIQLLGMGSDVAKDAFQRAQALLLDVPQHPARGPLLFRLGFMLCLRADYAEALALAARIEALAHKTGDPALLIAACTVHGDVNFLGGHPPIARQWLERGLAASDTLTDEHAEGIFIADPRVTLLSQLAIQLLHLGHVEQARACIGDARARARARHQAIAEGVAIWCEGLMEVRFANTERIAALAEQIGAIAEEFAFAQGHAGAKWMRGWVRARRGDAQAGFRLIREAYDENSHLGMRAGGSELLGYAAEALLRAGDWRAAQNQLDEALEIVNSLGERVYLPQLWLIEAAIAEARGDATSAYGSMRRAVGEARTQEAPWLEHLALRELCAHEGATDDERRALAELSRQYPEVEAWAVAAQRD
jgi:DNA-binding winged helix-turn-helix (wHTH) protein/tetratricopeptide (TPR) repeat protein